MRERKKKSMWIRQILVAVVGLASGFAVAAGLF